MAVLLLWSAPVWACPVCGGAGPNQQAFVDTMVFMSLSPLIMLGAIVGFVVYKVRTMPEELPVSVPVPVSDRVPEGEPQV